MSDIWTEAIWGEGNMGVELAVSVQRWADFCWLDELVIGLMPLIKVHGTESQYITS